MNRARQRELAAFIHYQRVSKSTPNQLHVEIVKQGRDAIRAWREQNPPPAHLELAGAHLYGIDLSGSDLEGADLRGAYMVSSNLRGASLKWAKLVGAHLTNADLRQVTLHLTDFSYASLAGANLTEIDFSRKSIRNTDLTDALFVNANLRDTNFAGSTMSGASLEGADVREARGLVLDENDVRGARFSPRAGDPWSVLRRSYTGTRLLFRLLLLIAFVMPLGIRTIFWLGVNRAETPIIDAVSRVRNALESSPNGGTESRRSEDFSPQRRKIAGGFRSYEVWQLLLGVDAGVTVWGLTVVLFFYNISRGVLTALVGTLRDEEQRTGISPPLFGWRRDQGFRSLSHVMDGYGWLIWPHRIAEALWYVAICDFVWHIWRWLTVRVWLPQ